MLNRLFIVFVALLVLFSGPIAMGHGSHSSEANSGRRKSKKSKKVRHSHSGGSSLSLELGLSATKYWSDGSSGRADESSGAETSENSHAEHMSILDEGHDHGEDAGASGSTDDGGTVAPAVDPMVTARLTYKIFSSFGLLCSAGYGFAGGIVDPEFGFISTVRPLDRVTLRGVLTASYPASKASRDNFKITAIKFEIGPNYQRRKLNLRFQILTAYAWYSKTLIYDDEEVAPQMSGGLHLDGDEIHDDSSNQAISPSDNNLAAADREFSRWGGKIAAGYRIWRRIRFDASIGGFIVNKQFGPSTWATQATPAQLTYSLKKFSAYTGFMLSSNDENLSFPSTPAINVGIGYTFR